jgi:uncharacterized protein
VSSKGGATIRSFRIVQTEGARQVFRAVDHYSLDADLTSGNLVRSPRGTAFLRTAACTRSMHGAMSPSIDDIRARVTALMRWHGVVRASVFGSVARGEATETSDVDFLVEFEAGRSLLDLSGLRLDLADALDREVDVATPNSLHPGFRDWILSELVPLL